MKILILTTHMNTGGISQYIATLAWGLIKKGLHVVVASAGGNMTAELVTVGAEHVTLPFRTKSEIDPRIYMSLGKLRRIIAEKNIDVIHSQTRVTQVMGACLSRLTGRPHVTTCHGFFKTRISRKLFPCWGRAVIAISEPVRRHLIDDFRVKEQKVFLIPNGIEFERFPEISPESREGKRREFGFGYEPVVGIIARLSDVKGHDVLLRAFQSVTAQIPDAKLMIVGHGKEEERLKKITEDLNLQTSVKFYPVVSRTSEILPVFDVFVMPSLQEGLGLSVMEAQACALPVVASRVGGIPSLIEHGKTGLLVEPRDDRQLAESIMMLLKDSRLAREMGKKAREFIRQNFSAEKMVEGTVGVYVNPNLKIQTIQLFGFEVLNLFRIL